MNVQFKKAFDQLEQERKTLFKSLDQYDDNTIHQKPSVNVWSVSEVLQHLVMVEKDTLKYLQKKTQDTSRAKKSGVKGQIKFTILKIAFMLPMRFKVPPTISNSFESSVNLKDLEDEWAFIRNQTFDLISKNVKDDDFKKELWRHPVSGKTNLFQMIEFTGIHFRRHQKQMQSCLNSMPKTD